MKVNRSLARRRSKLGLSGLFGWSGLSGSSGESRPIKHTRQTIRPDRRDRPEGPNEQGGLAGFFSILLETQEMVVYNACTVGVRRTD